MKKIFLFLLILSTILFAALQAGAITCTDISDVYIDQYSPTTNFNDKNRLLISYHPTKGIARGLLKFNIPSGITAAQIQSAILHLSGSGHTGGGNAITVNIHALNSPFGENTETWNTHNGGDYDATVFSSGSLPTGNLWLTTIDITTLIRGNLSKARANGMLIKLAIEGPDKLYQSIASRECDDTSNPDYVAADEPPSLEIILDSDEDGIPDDVDNCPNKPNGPELGTCMPGSAKAGTICHSDADCSSCGSIGRCSMNQEDTDGDAVGDVCDNCPNDCNQQQLDADHDGKGDVCDPTPGCGGCGKPACEQKCS